jgi:hypothetical protein
MKVRDEQQPAIKKTRGLHKWQATGAMETERTGAAAGG